MIIISFSIIFMGFLLISLSMKRHYAQIFSKHEVLPRRQNILLRIIGYAGIGIAGWLCIHDLGLGLGIVYWTGLLTVSAMIQALLFAYRRQWIMPSGLIALLIAITLGVFSL